MTPEEKKESEAKKLAAKEAEAKKLADEKAKKEADELAAKEAEAKKLADEKAEAKKLSGTFIMKVGHLSWGRNNKNHFYADKKPVISAKVMGKYSSTLKIWLDNNWIEKGSYK